MEYKRYLIIIFILICGICNGQTWVPGGVDIKGYLGGDLDVDGDLKVDGDLSIKGTLTLNGNVIIPYAKRWGLKIDKNNSDSEAAVEYMYDAVGMTPAGMTYDGVTGEGTFSYGDWQSFVKSYFRPVMLKYTGEVDYELHPDNQNFKLDGVTPSHVSDLTYAGNAMVEVKRIWLKITEDIDYIYISFSNIQYDDEYQAMAFTDENGKVKDAFYYSMFEGRYDSDSGKMRSIAGALPTASQSGTTEISRAVANGSGWYITSYSQHNLIALIHLLIGKDRNSQYVFGNGNSGSSSYIACGNLLSKGAFSGYNTEDKAVKTFWIENFYANYWKRCAGMLYRHDSDGVARLYYKGNPPYNDTGEGYDMIGAVSGTSGVNINQMYVSVKGAIIPKSTSGTTYTQYYGDGLYYTKPSNVNDCHYARVGGYRDPGSRCGVFALNVFTPLSGSGTSVVARLSFLSLL